MHPDEFSKQMIGGIRLDRKFIGRHVEAVKDRPE